MARIGAAAFLAGLVIPAHKAGAQSAASDPVSALLAEAKNQTQQLKSDASTMDFFATSTSAWEGASSIVRLYKDHIGAVQRQAARLEQARNAASPVQQMVIDRIVPLMNELASNIDTAIASVNKNPTRLRSAEGQDYFKANSELAGELASLIGNFVDYAQTRLKLERLSQKLELSSAVYRDPQHDAGGISGISAAPVSLNRRNIIRPCSVGW
jgi:hypothetical protein